MQSVANILINKVIARNSEYYDAHMIFKQDESVYLDCSIWIKELEQMNIDGICESDVNILPDIFQNLERFKDTFHLMQDCKIKIENGPCNLKITDVEHLSEHVTSLIKDLGDNFRQATLLEFLTVYIPGYKTHWSNQGKSKFDLRELDHELIPFRKKNVQKDMHEEVFVHEDGSEHIMIPTWRRKYVLKPESTDYLTFLQVGCNFRVMDKNKVTQELLQNLEENDGVLYREQLIPVITNQERYPNCPEFLPSEILLSNKQVLKLKKREFLMLPNVPLTSFGLKVLVEPFSREEDLCEETPPMNVLTRRLKSILPKSNFVIQ